MLTNEKLLRAIGGISDELIAGAAPREKNARRFLPMKKALAFAAAAALVFALSVSALAAADYEPAYKLLYSLSPAIAQGLKPLRLESQDKGIRLEVISARAQGSETKVYLSVQDLTGDRIDQTTDLFDSYGINTPFGSMGHCENAGYDAQTKTATFLVTITQADNQDITGDKITFSLRQLLGKKQTFDAALEGLDLEQLSPGTGTLKPAILFGGGGEGFEALGDDFRALAPTGRPYSPVKGVNITAMGYVDGRLRIQLQYENPLETDNHGYVYFKNPNGDIISGTAQYAFAMDAAGKERFEEHVYDIPQEDLAGLVPHGYFVTSGSLITGHWSVTFPLESVR